MQQIRNLRVVVSIDSRGILSILDTTQKVQDALCGAAQIFLEQCLISLDIIKIESREFPSVTSSGGDVVESSLFFRSIVPILQTYPGDVFIGITEREVVDLSIDLVPPSGQDALLSGTHYENILLISTLEMAAPMRVAAIVHELGQVFGAVHTDSGVRSVMTPDYTPFVDEQHPLPFDATNREIIRQNRFQTFNLP